MQISHHPPPQAPLPSGGSSRERGFRIFDALINYSSDALFELLLFLTPQEVNLLGVTSHNLRLVTNDEKLWIHFAQTRIKGFRGYIQTIEQLNAIRVLIRFPSYRQLFQSMQQLKFPLFGWFRLIPRADADLEDCQGGLYCLYPINGRVVCQYVDHQGHGYVDDRSLNVTYDADSHRVIGQSFATSKIYDMKFAESIDFLPRQLPRRQLITPSSLFAASFFFSGSNSESPESSASPVSTLSASVSPALSIVPLPPILAPSIAQRAQHFEQYFSCLGLFTSRYGSHGMEILHLSLHGLDDPTSLRFQNFQFGGLQLQALKITGDRNVPASKFSFCIDLMNTIDLVVPFVQDSRPIIIFPPDRENPVLTNWQQRIPAMQFCARGLGQINRIPGTWNPEWVRCSFVLYKMPIGEQRAMFSIVWDDENDHFRHAMDFQSLPEGNLAMIDHAISDMGHHQTLSSHP